MKEYYTTNSHYLTYTFLLKKLGDKIYFLNSLGVKEVINYKFPLQSHQKYYPSHSMKNLVLLKKTMRNLYNNNPYAKN